MSIFRGRVNSLPNDKFLDWSKLKALAEDKINATKRQILFSRCWLPGFSPFLTIFSKAFFFRVVNSRDYVASGLEHEFVFSKVENIVEKVEIAGMFLYTYY